MNPVFSTFATASPLGRRVGWIFAVFLTLPLAGWAQQTPEEARTNQEARASELRAAVRLQQANAAKKAQQAGLAAQKAAQTAEADKQDSRHLNNEERVQLRKQLAARELRAQQ